MSASLLRGLRILEMLAQEALGVSELARRLEVDKAGVSRVLADLRREGWVVRTGSLFVLGERALVLGEQRGPSVRVEADRIVRVLAASSGLTAVALRLSGAGAQPLALEEGPGGPELLPALDGIGHLSRTAAGLALLAQLPEDEVTGLLDAADWADVRPGAPRDASDARQRVALAREQGLVHEDGWTAPGISCLAVPWLVEGTTVPHALTLLGRPDRVAAGLADAERLLRAAGGVAP